MVSRPCFRILNYGGLPGNRTPWYPEGGQIYSLLQSPMLLATHYKLRLLVFHASPLLSCYPVHPFYLGTCVQKDTAYQSLRGYLANGFLPPDLYR